MTLMFYSFGLLLSVIIFFMVFIVLSIFGIKYALILALTAGIFEIIPYLDFILQQIPHKCG